MSLTQLDSAELEVVLQAATDLALVLDEEGRILETVISPGLRDRIPPDWEGVLWADTVTEPTRPKVEALIEEGFQKRVSRFRQVNHPLPQGDEIPMGYTAIRLGSGDRLLAVGKNLKALADLQRELVEAQQTMESEYWLTRQAEARYRLLFQQSGEPVFLVDYDSLRVVDANNAVATLLGRDLDQVVGRPFPPHGLSFHRVNGRGDHAHVEEYGFEELLDELSRKGAGPVRAPVRVGEEGLTWDLNLSLVRMDRDRILLARLSPGGEAQVGITGSLDVLELLERSPDGFVVTDPNGEILLANETFVDMTQVLEADDLVGRSLGLWLGRPGADLTVLLTNLRGRGFLKRFSTSIQGEHGLNTEVELSAVAAPEAEVPSYAFVLRDISNRMPTGREAARNLNGAVEELTKQVGRVSLKELVEDTVSLVELHFIDAALQLTGDNRTAAAELLGLSRQSLYTKLKRYNLSGGE